MAETEKIVIEVEIDNAAAKKNEAELIGLIERQRQELALRRKELKASNGTNKEAAKRVGELGRQLQSSSTQLRNNQKAIKANDNSINGLRASVSKLTAERNNLNVSSKRGQKEFTALTKKIKAQSDQLKGLEKSVGDTRRNVGNYAEGMKEAFKSTDLFGGALGGLFGEFAGLGRMLKSVIPSLKGVGGAMKAIPIFALIAALTTLVAFFKTTRRGTEFLEKSFKALEAVASAVVDGFAKVGEAIFDAVSNPKQALIDLGEAIKENVINRFKAFGVYIEAIALALDGEWSAAMKKAADASIQLTTGVTDGTDKMLEFGDAITTTVKAGFAMGQQSIALREKISVLNLEIAKQNRLAQEQLALSADASKANDVRIAAAEKSIQLESEIADKRVKIAQAQGQLIKNEIAGVGEATQEQRDQLRQAQAQEEAALAAFASTTKRAVNRLNTLKAQLAKEAQVKVNEQEAIEAEERQAWLDNRDRQLKESIEKRKAGEEAWTAFLNGQKEERNKIAAAEANARKTSLASAAEGLGQLASNLEEGTLAYKVFAIAQASIATYLAANKTLASNLLFPANVIAMAGVITTGLVNVAKIAGFAGGGIVGGGMPISRANGDDQLITAKTGEVILNKTQQGRIGSSALAGAGVPGFAGGGIVGAQMQSSAINSSLNQGDGLGRSVLEAIESMPAPVMDYKEFTSFQSRVKFKESRANV